MERKRHVSAETTPIAEIGGEQPVRFGTAPLKSGRLPNGAVWPIADRQLCDVERVEAPFNGTTDKRE